MVITNPISAFEEMNNIHILVIGDFTIWRRRLFQPILCPTLIFPWELISTFNQHFMSLSYRNSNRLQFKSSLFFLKSLQTCVVLIHLFPRCVPRSKDVSVNFDRYTCLPRNKIEGKLVNRFAKKHLAVKVKVESICYDNGRF